MQYFMLKLVLDANRFYSSAATKSLHSSGTRYKDYSYHVAGYIDEK